MQRSRKILACGLFRSGTNYVQALCDLNFETEPIPRHPVSKYVPYKHAYRTRQLQSFTSDIRLVFVYKSPFRWIDSLCRNSYNLIDECDLSYEPGHTVIEIRLDDEFDAIEDKPIIPVSLEKLCDLYNEHGAFWHRTRHCFNHAIVAHAELVVDAERAFTKMASDLGWSFDRFVDCDQVTNSRPFTEPIRTTYMTPGAYEFLNTTHIAVIRRRVWFDWRGMQATGNSSRDTSE